MSKRKHKPKEKNSEKLLALIFNYFERISEEKNFDIILSVLADLGRDIANAERCSLWLLNKKEGKIEAKFSHGVENLSVKAYFGIVGHSIETGKELIINDPYDDPRFCPGKDKETGYLTKCTLVIPIKNSKQEVIGAFQVLNKMTGDKHFTQEDLHRLRLAASYSGRCIENALLNIEMDETQREVIILLGEANETRSLETGNHVKRVARFSVIVGKKLGLSQRECDILEIASPMHDIGKVAIPDIILQKPDKLTPEEFEIIKTHTIIGYNILKNSHREIVATAAIIACQHHERYDGKGYPNKLKGNEININARITAVCDVFDALISDRIYKTAWKADEILSLLHQERGKQFDPIVIDAFFDSLEEIMQEHNKYYDE